jgi:hypothetical protein
LESSWRWALLALSRAFGLNVSFFLTPGGDWGPIGVPSAEQGSTPMELADAVHGLNADTREWVDQHIPLESAEGSKAMRRWRDDYAALVAHREARLAEVLAAHEALADELAASEGLAEDAREALADEVARREPARQQLDRLVNERDDGEDT